MWILIVVFLNNPIQYVWFDNYDDCKEIGLATLELQPKSIYTCVRVK